MIVLQKNDLQEILNLSQVVLECDSMDDLQHRMLLDIQRMIGADTSVYFDVSRTSLGWQFTNGFSNGVPLEAPKKWCDKYQTMDPFVARLSNPRRFGNRQVLTSGEIEQSTDYVHSEFYNDFLRPQSIYHMMAVGLTNGRRPIGLLGLHRSAKAPAFSRKNVAKVSAIVPHLSAAVQKIKLAEMTDIRAEIIRTLSADLHNRGLIILNRDLIPVFLDENTRATLDIPADSGHDVLRPIVDLLPATICRHCEEIRRTASSASTARLKQHIRFSVSHGSQYLSGYLYAYQPQGQELYFVICIDNEAAEVATSDAFTRFKLTRREIEIAHLISTGLTNPEVAEKLYISIRTVQAHLRSIYKKVKVHNRTSLVSRLMLDDQH